MSLWRTAMVLGALVSVGLVIAPATAGAEPSEKDKSEPNYKFVLPERVQLVTGQQGDLPMRLQPGQGYRVSEKGPLRIELRLSPESGLRAKKRRLSLRDAINPSSAAPMFLGQVSAAHAGTHQLSVSLDCWLCRGKLCRPVHTELQVQLDVSDPAPPALPDGGIPIDARTAPN